MAAGSCMNNISVKWLGSYLSQWLNFTLLLLQGDFIWCLNSQAAEENVTRSPKEENARRNEPARCEASTGRSVQADLRVTAQAEPPRDFGEETHTIVSMMTKGWDS